MSKQPIPQPNRPIVPNNPKPPASTPSRDRSIEKSNVNESAPVYERPKPSPKG